MLIRVTGGMLNYQMQNFAEGVNQAFSEVFDNNSELKIEDSDYDELTNRVGDISGEVQKKEQEISKTFAADSKFIRENSQWITETLDY